MLHRYLYLFSLVVVLALGSCASAKKQFEHGNYDKALEISVKKLRKDPADQKHIDILLNAYAIANERDLDEINRLTAEGSDQSWERIYTLYKRLDQRQSLVKQLPELKPTNPMTNTRFRFRDYSMELQNSKGKAVENLYNQGMVYLEKGDRFSCRTAYDYFNRAIGYDSHYKDVVQKKELARASGITYVLYTVNRQTNQLLPPDFEYNLQNLNLSGFNRDWLQIDKVQQGNIAYHYYIDAVITQVVEEPERIRETRYTETKTIEDGWEYAKNPDGSLRRDSLGNLIKVTVYHDINVQVTRVEQEKLCTVNGIVLIYENGSSYKIAQDAIYGNARFYNVFAVARGDNRALTTESLNLTRNNQKPFPTFTEMVMMASSSFNNAVYDKIRQYKNSFN